MTLPSRIATLGENGELTLPPEAMEAIDVEPGDKVKLVLDARRKEVRIERHVDDLWAEAQRERRKPGFEDLLTDHERRKKSADELWDRRVGKKPHDDE